MKKLMREREHKRIKLKRWEAQNDMRKMMRRLATQKMKYSDVQGVPREMTKSMSLLLRPKNIIGA